MVKASEKTNFENWMVIFMPKKAKRKIRIKPPKHLTKKEGGLGGMRYRKDKTYEKGLKQNPNLKTWRWQFMNLEEYQKEFLKFGVSTHVVHQLSTIKKPPS